MAKRNSTEVLEDILDQPSGDDAIDRLVKDQVEDFPKASEIQADFRFVDPFTIPKWCDQKNYAFAWADLRDDLSRQRLLEEQHFRIVTRVSCCIKGNYRERDFRNHGAVERRGLILVFRPKDIDDRLRNISVLTHMDMVSTLEAGKQGDKYDITYSKSRGEGDSRMDVYAYEEPGIEAPTAADLRKGELQT